MLGNRLLVVDDDRSVGEALKTTAAVAGYAIFAAADCAGCRRAMLEFKPSVVLLSVSIAGIDAIDILRVVLDHGSRAPILLTSIAEQNTVLGIQRLGQECGLKMAGYVPKPIAGEEMLPFLNKFR